MTDNGTPEPLHTMHLVIEDGWAHVVGFTCHQADQGAARPCATWADEDGTTTIDECFWEAQACDAIEDMGCAEFLEGTKFTTLTPVVRCFTEDGLPTHVVEVDRG